ncbi:hypothetical protein [Halegenticoccus tardaugens]|nr:hypothetical protein [Halegenticoccus tardaugens]
MTPGTGLPLGTAVALALMVAIPIAAYLLYRLDARRTGGYVSAWGRR